MKNLTFLFALVFAVLAYAQKPLQGVWTAGADKTITLPPAQCKFSYSYEKVGDATVKGSGNDNGMTTTISVSSAGDYLISIQPKGKFAFNYGSFWITKETRAQFKELKQWGEVTWNTNLWGMFYGCTNLSITATDIPDFSKVTNMESMFWGCTSITTIPNINNWDTKNVTDMNSMFYGATQFNQDISKWDTSQVTNMDSMFYGATQFNQDISKWNVGNVTNMNSMFYGATQFNQDISNWDVSKVTDMGGMFYGATAFNQDLSSWKVGNVTNMNSMFYGATQFNQNLGAWVVKGKAWLVNIFSNSGMSCENYSKTLKGWAENASGTQVQLSSNLKLKYGVGADTYKNKLINDKKWSISGDIYDASCKPDLSAEEIALAKTKVFVLNPVKDQLHIQGLTGITSIEVYNLGGQLVKILFRTDRQVSDLSNGVYILKINTPNGSVTEKILISK